MARRERRTRRTETAHSGEQSLEQYSATRIAALRLCTGPDVLSDTTRQLKAAMRNPPPMTPGTILAGVLSPHVDIDLGNAFVYMGVVVADLNTIDTPFFCKYTLRLLNPK